MTATVEAKTEGTEGKVGAVPTFTVTLRVARYNPETDSEAHFEEYQVTAHATDRMAGITWALDLTPLVADPARDVAEFTLGLVEKFRADVAERLR